MQKQYFSVVFHRIDSDAGVGEYERAKRRGLTTIAGAFDFAPLSERMRDAAATLEGIAMFDEHGTFSFAARDADELGDDAVVETLTPREAEVVRGIAAGKTNREIAREMFYSEKTIAACVSAVLEKFGLRSRVEIATRAVSGKPFFHVR